MAYSLPVRESSTNSTVLAAISMIDKDNRALQSPESSFCNLPDHLVAHSFYQDARLDADAAHPQQLLYQPAQLHLLSNTRDKDGSGT